ncbi:MAG TPA: hypothetical protein VFA04_09125 [Bryobacteraceae bacterium]|nr:hypothetical protein [Bryobacteraceae bacterium]
MNPIEQLNSYLRDVEARVRALVLSRGFAVAAVTALVSTIVLVALANQAGFAPGAVFAARIVMFVLVAAALCLALLTPALRLNRREAARRMEQHFPQFQERLLTLTERSGPEDPFAMLVADDALAVAGGLRAVDLAGNGRIAAFATSAVAAVVILLWMGMAGPGWIGYGTSLLWAGPHVRGDRPFYEIVVTPGNRTVRRRSDQLIIAHLTGFDSQPRLFARYRGASKWEQAPMQPQPGGNGYEFLFSGLTEQVDYYVAAGPLHSHTYTLRVVDLPGIQHLRVRYHYPAVYNMKDGVEDPGGDLRAVEGTEAEVEILTDQPLKNGVLALDDDSRISLEPRDGNWLAARVPITRDGTYHIAALDNAEPVRLTDDYFIEAKKDTPPEIRITRPGRDARVNPIEEVPVTVEASDDFALEAVNLHYSVNGGPEQTVAVADAHGVKQTTGKTTLYLENFKLVPGDLVSVYATARDAKHTAKTDIFFIQAEPFERNYEQQQAAGSMGGQQDDTHPSEHQKEVIAATWNALKGSDAKSDAENAKFISGVEDKLSAQARSLAQRMRSRQLTGASDQFKSFSQEMDDAAAEMDKASAELRGMHWTNALPAEQKGLQHLLRAEATFRDIQVAFGSQAGGRGGSGRDLQNMFDLELDTQKNQYETGEQASAEQRDKAVDDMMQKLADLARRQQELAAQQKDQQTFQQRWQQEMLRREAEELKRQMEQLARNGQSQQQSQQQGQQQQGSQASQGQQSQSSASSSPSSGSSGGASGETIRRAMDQLSRAMDDMRRGSTEQGSAGQRRAAERLQEARDMLRNAERQQAQRNLRDMADRAEQLAQAQRESSDRLRQAAGASAANNGDNDPRLGPAPPGRWRRRGVQDYGAGEGNTPADPKTEALAREKEQLAREVQQLQNQMSAAAQAMAGGQPHASSKLRAALGEAQQSEITSSMKKAAEFLRRGFGSAAWGRDQMATMGMDRLRDQLRDAQQALQQDAQQQASGSQPGAGQGREETERQLAQVEDLRRRAEQMAGSSPQGQRAQGFGQTGGGRPVLGGSNSPETEYRQMMRDIARMGDTLRGTAAADDSRDLMNQLGWANPPGSDAELNQRIQHVILPGIERMELQLRRSLDAKGQPLDTGGERVPPGYSDALAEYFRRLSQVK